MPRPSDLIQHLTRKLPKKTMFPVKYEALVDVANNTNYPTLCYSHAKYSYSISISTWKDNGLKLIANYTPAEGLGSVNMPSFPGDTFLQSLFTFYIINSIIALLIFVLLTVMLVL